MEGATLILEDSYFYPRIYMSPTSVLDAKGGSQNLIVYREMTASLIDTANCLWLSDSIYTQMNITFNTWPSGNSPCSLAPTAVQDINMLSGFINVSKGELIYKMNEFGLFDCTFFDMQGRALIRKQISNQGSINIAQMASGIYIVNIRKGNKILTQKVLLN
jgi:hypothetical protein